MSKVSDIIDWDEALQQAGDDEEFLLELLGDFRDELMAQIAKINVAIETRQLLSIQSAAHVIKGAAANLMCEPLREASYNLEMIAKHHPKGVPLNDVEIADLNNKYWILKETADKYMNFLDDHGI